MRSQLITALCVAPLALAATLQADLVTRGIVQESSDLVARGSSSYEGSQKSEQSNDQSKSKSDNNDNSKGGNNNNGGTNVLVNNVIEENTVVILWMNEGGGAETSTVTSTVTVTENGQTQASTVMSAPGTGKTHQVRLLL